MGPPRVEGNETVAAEAFMLMIRTWRKHNRRILKDVTRNRVKRQLPIDLPLALERVVVSVRLDSNFQRFAELVGGRCAETFFLRVLQYAAVHDGRHGTIQVPPARFGPAVLSTSWDLVSVPVGRRVYAALVKSSICSKFVRGQDCGPDCDCGADKSRDVLRPPTSDLRPLLKSSTANADENALSDLAGGIAAGMDATPRRPPRSRMSPQEQRDVADKWAAEDKAKNATALGMGKA